MLEKSLGRLEGVRSAKMGRSKFYYELKVSESKTLLPSHIKKMCDQLQDYSYRGFEITAISGKVEKSGEEYVFTARGSNQKYALKPSDDLKKLVAGGKSQVTLAGTLEEPEAKGGKKPLPLIEVSEAKELSK